MGSTRNRYSPTGEEIMVFKIGTFDIENAIGHNARTKRVGTNYLNITGDYAKGETGAYNFIQSLTDEFKWAGRYAKFVIPGGSADNVQDYSPDSSVLRYVSSGGGAGNDVSGWYCVDDYNYNMRPGYVDHVSFWIRLTRVHQ